MIETQMARYADSPQAKRPPQEYQLDFREVHLQYRPKIYRYLTRLVGPSEAEDLTQEVFLKVSRALKRFRRGSRLSTWIYRIATNTALDEMRKPSFRRPPVALEAEMPCSAAIAKTEEDTPAGGCEQTPPTAERSLINREMLDCLRKYIDQLPPNHRAVIILSVLEGMKNREIAEILGLSIETVKIRLHRGRSTLIKDLENHCGWYRDKRNRLIWDGKIL